MKKFALLLLFVSFFAGCKEDTISPDDKEKVQPESMEMTDFEQLEICYKVPDPKNPPSIPEVFTNDSLYRAILQPFACQPLPNIDFSKRTLVKTRVNHSAERLNISFRGVRDDSLKIYAIVVETAGQLNIDPIAASTNIWYTIPKIRAGYTIKAKQEKIGFITTTPSTYEIIPSGITKDLFSVSFGDSLIGFISGASGTFLKTTNGGLSWNILSSGTTKDLHSIFAVSPNVVYACGADGIILKSTNGGSAWVQHSSGTNTKLNSLFFKDELNGFVVGGRMENNSSSGIILKTTNGGESWVKISSENFPLLHSISFQTPDYGIAVGQSVVGGSSNSLNIVRTSDGGNTWETISSGTNETLYGVTFADTSSKMYNSLVKKEYGWVVGTNGTILTTDFTKAWKISNSRTTEDLFCIGNALDPWLSMAFTGGKNGSIYRSVDDGDSWFKEKTGSAKSLYGIANTTKYIQVVRPAPSYAVGSNGTIVKIKHGERY